MERRVEGGAGGGTFKAARFAVLAALLLGAGTHATGDDPPRQAPVREVAGLWRGGYAYPAGAGKRPVPFTAVIARTADGFEGAIWEPATFGDRSAPTLTSVVRGGPVDDAGRVRFTKRYDGRGGVSHEVTYEGVLARSGSTITGTWTTSPSETGTFTMLLVPAFPDVAGAWSGTYTNVDGGQVRFAIVLAQTDGVLSGSVVEPATFGDGSAERLTAAIREGTVEADGRLRFVKRYDGRGGQAHAVAYEGRLSSDGSKIVGTWTLASGSSGAFEMVRE